MPIENYSIQKDGKEVIRTHYLAESPAVAIAFAISDHPKFDEDKSNLIAVVVEDGQVSTPLVPAGKPRKPRKDKGQLRKAGEKAIPVPTKKARAKRVYSIFKEAPELSFVGAPGLLDYLKKRDDANVYIMYGIRYKYERIVPPTRHKLEPVK